LDFRPLTFQLVTRYFLVEEHIMDWGNWYSSSAKAAKASDIRELLKLTARPDMISFAGGLPDPSLFPLANYEAALQRVIGKHGKQALQYSTTEGIGELREELVGKIRADGIACPDGVDNLILMTGSQQALDLLARLLIDPGDTILVEAPSYLGALQAFDLQQPRYEAVEMDGQGLIIEALAAKLAQLKQEGRRPKFLYTVPTFQNPTGVTLTLERRHALMELAERENLLIIEDDPYGRLRFRGEHLPSLKSLDRSERVISLRTFSKTLSPALRTGYVIGPQPVLRQLVILKQAADLCSSALTQYAILELLKSDVLEQYVEKVKSVYGQKELAMAAALQAGLGHTSASWNEPEGGMFFWVTLPEGVDSGELLAEALKAGVAYVKGSAFYTDKTSGQNSLRLNFSHPSLEQIQQGIGRLTALVDANLKILVTN